MATDVTGNKSHIHEKEYTIDLFAPNTVVLPPGKSYNQKPTISMSCADNHQCSQTFYSIDTSNDASSDFQIYTKSFQIEQSSILRYYSIDTAGNKEQTQLSQYFIFEDNISPSLPVLIFPKNNEVVYEGEVNFGWKSSSDQDDEILFYTLKYCKESKTTECKYINHNPLLSNDKPLNVRFASSASPNSSISILFSLLLTVIVTRFFRTINKSPYLLITVIIIFISFSCGSERNDFANTDISPEPNAETRPYEIENNMVLTVSDLDSNSRYYWNVTVDDTKGGVAESETRLLIIK